jgi:hypothetical protein
MRFELPIVRLIRHPSAAFDPFAKGLEFWCFNSACPHFPILPVHSRWRVFASVTAFPPGRCQRQVEMSSITSGHLRQFRGVSSQGGILKWTLPDLLLDLARTLHIVSAFKFMLASSAATRDCLSSPKTRSARSSKNLISTTAFAGREQDSGPNFGPESNGGHVIAELDTSILFVRIATDPDCRWSLGRVQPNKPQAQEGPPGSSPAQSKCRHRCRPCPRPGSCDLQCRHVQCRVCFRTVGALNRRNVDPNGLSNAC